MIETIAELQSELCKDLEAIRRVQGMLARPVELEKLLVAEADFNHRAEGSGQYYSRRLTRGRVLSMAESHESFEVEATEEELPKLRNLLFASRYRWSVDLRDGNLAIVNRIEWAS